jgi:hypothetical protein
MESDQSAERAIVTTFVEKSYRARLLGMIDSPRARRKLTRELIDLRRLDARFVVPIPPNLQTFAGIQDLLRKHGAPAECYVISEKTDWDTAHLPLVQALHLTIGSGWATLVVCRPESLVYYEGEAPNLRVILAARAAPNLGPTRGGAPGRRR